MAPQPLLTLKQVSEYTHYGMSTLRRYIRKGLMPIPSRAGGSGARKMLFTMDEIETWVRNNKSQAVSPKKK